MEKEKQSTQAHNLRFYQQACEVPQDALKPIRAGRLKGMSDVNPMWRMKRLTEIFGPCGFGWKYTIDRQWVEVYGQEVKCFCNVSLFVRDPETKEWSEAIPGSGGSAIVSVESKGPYVNDEGYKMALTDALSIAMKPLGIGANIWYGSKATGHNESKYEQYTTDQPAQVAQQPYRPRQEAYTEAQQNQALAELKRCNTYTEAQQVWVTLCHKYPAMCQNTTEFYKKAAEIFELLRQTA